MKNKNLKNSIVSFILIVSTILMPFSLLPREAEAQFNSSSSFGVSGYVRGLAPAIAKLPQCKEEIGSGIKKLFSGIFGSGETGGPIDPNEEYRDTDYSTNSSSDSSIPVDPLPSLEKISKSFTIQVKTSGVSDIEAKKQLEESNKKLERIAKSSEYINENSSCIQSIGRLIAKMLLQKLTMSTVNWINSGYDGSPSFIQDADKFFSDIAKTEILQFGIEIEGISPFSKDWMRNNALALKTKFADNARYSLEEMIAQTTPGCDTNGVVSGVSGVVSGTNGVVTSCSEAFSKDFSVGGWDAWTAMTQVPANNPLGAKLMFDNEIQKRLDGTSQSTAKNTRDALQAASGFLGDQRCVDPKGVTKEEHEKGLRERSNLPQNSEDQMQYQYINRICNKWEYVTPGKMVADAATTVMGYQNNSLLNVEDLNDAVAAISDAILNKFSTNIYEKGFANIGYEGIDGVLVFSGSTERYRTQTQKDYIPSQLSSSWLQANPEFNIRTELTQALIDEQRTYSDKLALQNKELMSTTDGEEYNMGPVCPEDWLGKYPNCEEPPTDIFNILGGLKLPDIFGIYKNPIRVSNAYGLMPAIYQLDYCIPGPHPGWEDDSREILNNISIPQKETSSNTAGDIANGVIGMGIGIGASFIPVVGSFVGPVLSSLFGGLAQEEKAKDLSSSIRGYYTNKFAGLTGYQPQTPRDAYQSTDPAHVNMTSGEGVSYVLNTILDRYINIMRKTYFSSPDILPAIANEAEKEFNQLPGYNQIIKDNKNKMLEIKTTVSILGDIKDEVDKLNTDLETNQKTEEQYEEALKFQINAFGRLSASMVNGDDIAAADDLAKQIIAKKDFIYKNLLKGPYGCEADLEKIDKLSDSEKNFPSANPGVKQATNDWSNYNINSVKRMTYPFPILYDYNNLTKEDPIPDPWTDCSVSVDKRPKSCSNTMPTDNQYDKYGPGFLSFVYFGTTVDSSRYYDCKPSERMSIYNGTERLTLNNLVNNHNPLYEKCDAGWSKEWGGFLWTSLGKSNILKINDSINDLKTQTAGLFEQTIGVY